MYRIITKLAAVSVALPAVVALTAVTATAQTSDPREAHQNPQASDVSLERLDGESALISATFPELVRQEHAHLVVDGERFTFENDGSGEGVFVLKAEFDFKQLSEGVEHLARLRAGEERPVFARGGRHISAQQRVSVERDHVFILEQTPFFKREFRLPLNPDDFRVGSRLDIPVNGLPLGLPLNTGGMFSADASKSIMITDLDVVNDPARTWSCQGTNQPPSGTATGAHTFWRLMGNISNGSASTSDYIKQFFNHWNISQVINGQVVAARPHVYDAIIGEWEQRSGGAGADLMPEHSPFKLLAVALRLDLRGAGSAYGGGDAGEARYVFGLHDGNCNSMGKTIILEYKVPISGCNTIRNWAQKWIALESSSNYNADLEDLTQVFAAAGANPNAPNGSAIGQIRTNEFLPQSPIWDLRELVLNDNGGFMTLTTVKQEPQEQHNNSQLLADYVNQHWSALIHHNHVVPEIFGNQPMLAGSAPAPVLWNVPQSMLNVPNTPQVHTHPSPNATNTTEALFGLALNTCSGCHQLETGVSFAHIHYNTQPGQEAILSGFLEGISLPDPRTTSIMRDFNDLERREQDLEEAASMSCATIGTALPGNLVLQELTRSPVLNTVH